MPRSGSVLLFLLTTWLGFWGIPSEAQPIRVSDTSGLTHESAFGKPDTNQIRALLELGKKRLRPSYTRKANRDSALLFFRRAETLSARIGHRKWLEESQCLQGIAYLLDSNWPKGKAYFMKVVRERQERGDKAGEIRALLRMATTIFCDDCQENRVALERALALAREIGDRSQEMLILMEMGYQDFQLHTGDTKEAETKAQQVMAIQTQIGSKPLTRAYHELADGSVYKTPTEYGYLSNAYYFLSDISQARGDLNQKLFYILKVVRDAEESGQPDELDYAYYRLGNAYYELGQFDKSVVYYHKSLALSRKKGVFLVQMALANRMALTLLRQGKPREALRFLQDVVRKDLPYTYEDVLLLAQSFGACYDGLKQYSVAEMYYLRSVAWSDEVTSGFQYSAWRKISQFYVAHGQFEKASPYLTQLLAVPGKKIIPSHRIEVHWMRFKVDSAQGNYLSAIRHYQKYKTLNDSVFNVAKSKQISQLSIQYETEKKDQDLKLKGQAIQLLTEKSLLQQNQLRQATYIRNGIFAGAVLLILLLGLGFKGYRVKKHINQLLEAKQVEINRQNHALQHIVKEKDHLLIDREQLLTDKDRLLEEREWMLREMHHRVKNNLQIITSLLHSQGSFLKDKEAFAAIRESQNRVHAMALIHQKLYQADRLSSIPMNDYTREIVDYLINSFDRADIRREFNVDPIDLDIAFAVPLGLILNEAVTNSLKYAFPKGRIGTLRIEFKEEGPKIYRLVIADDGIGFPADLNPNLSRTLGMSLIRGLSEQIDGTLRITQTGGVQITLRFFEDKAPRIPA
ncbi:Two-component sensor histidine kinase, contains HisKA and HATPase domains [Dyadobacter sp. SG02]|uniref:histidine kinase dimerization/phosphoacceptor domain -containing protein n=1 Tax=Dyadobacter sp. SG02 TaxID=1855291 RepID=UPI0008ABB7EC|nr:histidine kinase dimerization/phosphoacceptor domain -containing protein [Dyadobacter sp. SG02]SEJ59907.1 Two-component sensor histidine kinase, contains HisKA and HATPase domains [Dyadobacter sp. SG02]